LIQWQKVCLLTVVLGDRVIEFVVGTEEIIIYRRGAIDRILKIGHINLKMKLNRLLTIKLLQVVNNFKQFVENPKLDG
jgi:hypothetical protein